MVIKLSGLNALIVKISKKKKEAIMLALEGVWQCGCFLNSFSCQNAC